ncbi:hypothetical protein GIB67_030513 [Kingdonia uniflora]|uniref:Uncharacterized protein n=1 Tax=Kingdonia uniflora TaxID=39325 RepID=A0A7J7LD13_9MAGN|nr:hypothetical protein GIB67_030513 [Kingdonia uniflora]
MRTKLVEFCAHALLTLEVLIHPLALPLEDFPTSSHDALGKGYNRRLPDSLFSASQKRSSAQNPIIEAGVTEEVITNVDFGDENMDEVMVDFERLQTPINGGDAGTSYNGVVVRSGGVSNHRDDVIAFNEMVSSRKAMVDAANLPVHDETNKL